MIDLKDLCINHTASIEECLMKIDSNGLGIIFLVDEMVLKGVLSDGDIRRYLLRGGKISKIVELSSPLINKKIIIQIKLNKYLLINKLIKYKI